MAAKKKKKTTSGRKKAASSRKKSTRSSASTRKKTARSSTGKKKITRKKKTSSGGKNSTRKKTTRKSTRKKKTAGKKTSSRAAGSRRGTGKKTTTNKKTSKKKSSTKKSPATTSKKKTSSKKKRSTASKSKSAASPGSNGTEGLVADENGYVMFKGRRVRMISSRGVKKKRKSSRAKAVEAAAEPRINKAVKTTLSRKELKHFLKLLLEKRAELVGNVNAMEFEALRSSDGDISHMPMHMADVGSDVYEQDFMLGLAESERERVREIDEAIQRIVNKTYGMCMLTGEPIGTPRLEAKPWAKYSIEGRRRIEAGEIP